MDKFSSSLWSRLSRRNETYFCAIHAEENLDDFVRIICAGDISQRATFLYLGQSLSEGFDTN